MTYPGNSLRSLACASLVAAIAAICMTSAQVQAGGDRDVEINTLSSRANTVSGGDAVIEVRAPRYVRLSDLVVRLNGRDVTAQFTADAAGHRLTGLLTGLLLGKNQLTVSGRRHHRHQHFETLEITNHPIHGEIFGPHQRPWVCETAASGVGAPPTSGPCVAATKYEWFYRSTGGALLPLPAGPVSNKSPAVWRRKIWSALLAAAGRPRSRTDLTAEELKRRSTIFSPVTVG